MSSTQGDPDDPDAGNLTSLRDDPDSSSLQRIEHLIGIYGPTHNTTLYCISFAPAQLVQPWPEGEKAPNEVRSNLRAYCCVFFYR